MRYLKYILIIFLLNQSNVNALIEVDITRGNLNPLPIAVSSLSIEKAVSYTHLTLPTSDLV